MLPPPTLCQVWPEVEGRLKLMMRRRGVDHAAAEDAAQETAVRVLRSDVRFVDAADLFRWAAVVGWRVVLDARRKERWAELRRVPDGANGVNVAGVVEQRSVLEAVVRMLDRLSADDRQVILGSVASEWYGVEQQQRADTALRRHRARARLLRLLE